MPDNDNKQGNQKGDKGGGQQQDHFTGYPGVIILLRAIASAFGSDVGEALSHFPKVEQILNAIQGYVGGATTGLGLSSVAEMLGNSKYVGEVLTTKLGFPSALSGLTQDFLEDLFENLRAAHLRNGRLSEKDIHTEVARVASELRKEVNAKDFSKAFNLLEDTDQMKIMLAVAALSTEEKKQFDLYRSKVDVRRLRSLAASMSPAPTAAQAKKMLEMLAFVYGPPSSASPPKPNPLLRGWNFVWDKITDLGKTVGFKVRKPQFPDGKKKTTKRPSMPRDRTEGRVGLGGPQPRWGRALTTYRRPTTFWEYVRAFFV